MSEARWSSPSQCNGGGDPSRGYGWRYQANALIDLSGRSVFWASGCKPDIRRSDFHGCRLIVTCTTSRLYRQVNSTHLSVSDSAICHFPTSTSAHSVRMGNHPINPYQASLLTRQVRRGLYRFLRVCRVCTSQSLPRNGEMGLPADLKVLVAQR